MAQLPDFSPSVRTWFEESFAEPTPAQSGAWEAIAAGESALIVAPTGSGKTLAAFLWAIDQLSISAKPPDDERLEVLYISPLKALAVDIERNLRSPLNGIRNIAARSGDELRDIRVGLRTGDTSQAERRQLSSRPPDILITTPESLFLMLTSAARESLRHIKTVIIDEVHAVAATKRGSHLAVSLERVDALLTQPAQRIGLSATVRPVEEVAAFLGGPREVRIVQPAYQKDFDLKVVVPVEDMTEIGELVAEFPIGGSAAGEPVRRSMWPSIHREVLDLIRQHRSTLIFTNSRRLAERLCTDLNDLAREEIARSHHGSVSKEQRKQIEEDLKAGRLPAVVATSSLELGIDMGSIDLVVQIEAPTSVASGLQRVGRAGHQVGATSRGIVFPKWRGDLVESAVVVERMRAGKIEAIRYPRNPLDVLAQHVVSMVGMDEWSVDELADLVRGSAPFSALPDSALESVLDMLSGLYPSDDFAELRPRINYDRGTGRLTSRQGSKALAITSGGTIPDRGLFGVFLAGETPVRVGELDEEYVYESRVGEVFTLGASSWRIQDISHDRVIVTPAPGEPGKMPFWHGDALGRPAELGSALGAFMREISSKTESEAQERLGSAGLDENAAANLISYLKEQQEATGHLPDDRTIVVERFRDELGDWRLCVHSPFGARLHAPWSLAIEGRVRDRLGLEVQTMYTDDGIVVRLPEADEAPSADYLLFEPEEIEALVTNQVGSSALFSSRFRECAARALLLPRRRPGKRTPLWQQRQKSANLLQAAAGYGSFPMILETMRECLQDVFDLPGLIDLMHGIRSRRLRVVEVETDHPSPFASSLLFGYIGAFIYDGDAPLAERRAQALSLDPQLLAELLGQAEMRELIDAEALEELESELQLLTGSRSIKTIDAAHDALRNLGDLSLAELVVRGADPSWMQQLESSNRALAVRIAGEQRWIAAEDASRYRDALGTPLPTGVPEAFLQPIEEPLAGLIHRYARTHGPFDSRDPASRWGVPETEVLRILRGSMDSGKLVRGEFRPGGLGAEWCDAEVLRRLKRSSLARLRKEVEAVPQASLVHFLPAWQGVGSTSHRGVEGILRVIEQIQGMQIPASVLEKLVLPARVLNYSPAMIDELCAAGEVIWAGTAAVGNSDGWISLYIAEDAPLLLPDRTEQGNNELEGLILGSLSEGGAMFFRQLADHTGVEDNDLIRGIWDLVWKGRITSDTLGPLRSLTTGGSSPIGRSSRRGRYRLPLRQGPPTGAGRWSHLPDPVADPTRRLHATAEQLLDRHGILTRGAVRAEAIDGGFARVYPVLKAFEESGKYRRGYFIEGLGAAQFAVPGAVDRLRSINQEPDGSRAFVLSAADPANPFGAALPWPPRPESSSHRPGRKAGALVVFSEDQLVLYVEKGGKSLLTWTQDPDVLQPAVDALALAVREGALGKLAVEKADGEMVVDSPLASAMVSAGFRVTPRGLRIRA